MSRTVIILGSLAFVGLTLLLSELRWFKRVSIADRLAPYSPGAGRGTRSGLLSVASFREVIAPLSQSIGERIARLFGVSEELSTRLTRIHSPLTVTEFRVRQVGWAVAVFGAATLAAIAFSIPAPLAILAMIGGPVLAFLVLEQMLALESERWQRRLFLELPVIAEQLGMLLSAGWSLTGALARIAARGRGVCSTDLIRVQTRMRQGLSEVDALKEWAVLADVDVLDKLVSVLALNRETADLGRMISEEARSIRRESQRELIEMIERRSQQVWIPVTVAALVPGVLLMGVPFVDALSLFAGQ